MSDDKEDTRALASGLAGLALAESVRALPSRSLLAAHASRLYDKHNARSHLSRPIR